ncbi:MAG: DUF2516 family protein [Nakamurella sp.]
MALVVSQIIYSITLVLGYGGAALGVFCVLDAVRHRADAFVAADKQTKGTWVGISVACAVILVFGAVSLGSAFGPQQLLWLAALIGVMVYICDVRPNVKRVAGGNSRW